MKGLTRFLAITIAFTPSLVAAQASYQLVGEPALRCEAGTCTRAGERCDFGTNPAATCRADVGDRLICNAGHIEEVYCCSDDADCPGVNGCVAVEGAGFGVCLGPDTIVTFCSDRPTPVDLDNCRDRDFGSAYDWGHGDCDADGIANEVDPDPCSASMGCACDADVLTDAGGDAGAPSVVGSDDFFAVRACALDPALPECGEEHDINCDGAIDFCDAEVVIAQMGNTAPDPSACAALECGTCVIGEECERAGPTVCTDMLGGDYLGSEPCPGDPPPPPPPPPRPMAPERVVEFRGAGGCDCHVGRQKATGPGALVVMLLLVGVSARRRRRR